MIKRHYLLTVIYLLPLLSIAQNAPLSWWGSGLDGSTYQKAVVYVDVTNGLLFDAPKTSTGAKLPIHFNWRGGGPSPLYIAPNSNVGLGTSVPGYKLTVTGGAIALDADKPLRGGGVWLISGNSSKVTVGSANNIDLQMDAGASARMIIKGGNGNVGIGTTAPDSKLTVKGVIHAEEVKVDLAVPGPDYVFDESYPLRSLEDTKAYIDQNKHLPGIPSSDEMQQNGVNLLEMNMKLLEKVEELTLHLIEQDRRNNTLQTELLYLKEEMKELKSAVK